MSALVYPDLPGLDVAVDREVFYRTTIHETVSGKEDRASWQSTPRYRYTLTYNLVRDNVNAPSPLAAYSEAAVLLKFLDDHKGSWDSFTYTDPYSGVATTVRLDADSLKITRVADHMWTVVVGLVSVK